MASREYQNIQKQIKQLEYNLNNLVMALFELKIFKVKIDENGQAIYDTGKDEQSEVQ